ncbi:hypothetical protein NIES4075_02720 [Tolypothrix sp. NIES-4075]|nr:hypothetical protein NIES4075_02720 [Tolypothrix sp. NIES-4075]
MGGWGEGGEKENIESSLSPLSPHTTLPPHHASPVPKNGKSPEQLSIIFPTQRSGLSFVNLFKRPISRFYLCFREKIFL